MNNSKDESVEKKKKKKKKGGRGVRYFQKGPITILKTLQSEEWAAM